MSKFCAGVKTASVEEGGKIYICEKEMTLNSSANGEDVLRDTLSAMMFKKGEQERVFTARHDFAGESPTAKLLSCVEEQENSFWAMFYAEFYFIVNFILGNGHLLFPPEKGFQWNSIGKNPDKFMTSENRDIPSPEFQNMANAVRNYIACIFKVTPSIISPVGKQHRFIVNLVCIHSATEMVVRMMCSKDSYLGGCNPKCGGEFTSKSKDPMVNRYTKSAMFFGSRGGATSASYKMRNTTTYAWMYVRDKLINLKAICDNATFVTTMFTNLACGVLGSIVVYEPHQIDAAQEADPLFWGYKMREEVINPELDNLDTTPFDYMKFAIHLACHTGIKVRSYLPPIHQYNTKLRRAFNNGLVIELFDKAWCNSMGLFERSVVTDFTIRMVGEHSKYPTPPVSDTFEYSQDTFVLSDTSAVVFRVSLNNHHHLSTTAQKLATDKFNGDLSPDLVRNGIDDYHRNSASPHDPSLVINWTKHVFASFPELRSVLTRHLVKAAGKYIEESVSDILRSEDVCQTLLEEEEQKREQKREEELLKCFEEEKKKKKKKKKKKGVAQTKPRVVEIPVEIPTDVPEKVNKMSSIIREGGAIIITRNFKSWRARHSFRKSVAAIKIQRACHASTSNKLLTRFKQCVFDAAMVRGIEIAIAVTKVARWYKKQTERWIKGLQLVVFDNEAYTRRLADKEAWLDYNTRQLTASIAVFNTNTAIFALDVKMHKIMAQVEHYMVRTYDDFVNRNLCPDTYSLSVRVLAEFPILKAMTEGCNIQIIPDACMSSMCLQVVFDSTGEVAIKSVYN